jgi:hypothetical protein
VLADIFSDETLTKILSEDMLAEILSNETLAEILSEEMLSEILSDEVLGRTTPQASNVHYAVKGMLTDYQDATKVALEQSSISS